MARVKAPTSPTSTRSSRRAITPEARENQMISLAMDLVEQRLRDGTASSQETTHFLKLATAKYKSEVKEVEQRVELGKAKTETLQSAKRVEELYTNAIKAFRNYNGQCDADDYENY